VWFGANDAVLPGYEQHVDPDQYRRNLISIITHPAVKAQRPKTILVTPPPVDEYSLPEHGMGGTRTAERTKLYADITKEVGKELGVAVVDIWTCLMEKSGWQPETPLNGSLAVSRNWAFSQFFVDGKPRSISRR
jgi:isoamyl acetate esterase